MNFLNSIAGVFGPAFTILSPLIPAAVCYAAYAGIALAQKNGYKMTYASALVRAAGAGMAQAQASGLNPFSPAGMAIGAKIGAQYMVNTVAPEAAKLGISTVEDHATRVLAQIQTVQSQAMADAQATTAASVATSAVQGAVSAAIGAVSTGSVPASAADFMASLATQIKDGTLPSAAVGEMAAAKSTGAL